MVYNASYVFYGLMPFSKARSLWCCEYSVQFCSRTSTRGQKSWSDRTSCLFGFSWGANSLPNSLLLHLISKLCFICTCSSGLEIQSVPQSISLELAGKPTCHSHFRHHGLSRFIRSRDPVSYPSLFNLWLHLTIVYLCLDHACHKYCNLIG